MLVILSPSKTLESNPQKVSEVSQPRLLSDTKYLSSILKKMTLPQLMEQMSMSEKLAIQNLERFQSFQDNHTQENGTAAVFTYKGEVYVGLQPQMFSDQDLVYAQDHLRILSGLYGVLRPLDIIQAYRLEIGTRLENKHGKNLYDFWGDKITKLIQQDLKAIGSKYLINLASNEYFKAIDPKLLGALVIDIQFFEMRNGKQSFVSFNAKKARGLMAAYIIKQRCNAPSQLKDFNTEGYVFRADASTEQLFTFVKG